MCHVLIIEDQSPFAALLEQAVHEAGATSVDVAATEQEAVSSARRQVPAIITSDVELPQGSGPSAVRRIRERFGAIPVLFITAQAGFRAHEPADPVMTKPATRRQIVDAVRRLRMLGRQDAGSPVA